jgi:hypothetical protein
VPKNELLLLDALLRDQQESRDQPLPDHVAFERLVAELALRERGLSEDELMGGIVGGGNDGGIDAAYVFLGDLLLDEDAAVLAPDHLPADSPKGCALALWLIQAKQSEGFAESAFDLASSSLGRLLDLDAQPADLAKLYNADLIRVMSIFTTTWRKLATRQPQITVRFVYASRGYSAGVDTKVHIKAQDLARQLRELVSGAEVSVEMYGAVELWQLSTEAPDYTLELAYQENATSGNSHVALVRLKDYFDFITEADGSLRRHIFDWNVRDYAGAVAVNKEIRHTLMDEAAPDFWWLNNGVTVVCSSATLVGKTYVLQDVQIVNGLQTSHTIHDVFEALDPEASAWGKSLLVRILSTDDKETRDRVIRATNKQTTVPDASLRATDDVQRKIETYFLNNGWFYDRRKNYYRNMGKAPDRIVSIPFLAQAVMAMGLGEPNNSRARPSSLLTTDNDYVRIFAETIDVRTYLWCAKTQRAIDTLLSTPVAGAAPGERTNLRFYVAMVLVSRALGRVARHPSHLAPLVEADHAFSDKDVILAFDQLRAWMKKEAQARDVSDDRVAKSPDWVAEVKKLFTAS